MPLSPAVIIAAAEVGLTLATDSLYMFRRAKEEAEAGNIDLADDLLRAAKSKFDNTILEFDETLEGLTEGQADPNSEELDGLDEGGEETDGEESLPPPAA